MPGLRFQIERNPKKRVERSHEDLVSDQTNRTLCSLGAGHDPGWQSLVGGPGGKGNLPTGAGRRGQEGREGWSPAAAVRPCDRPQAEAQTEETPPEPCPAQGLQARRQLHPGGRHRVGQSGCGRHRQEDGEFHPRTGRRELQGLRGQGRAESHQLQPHHGAADGGDGSRVHQEPGLVVV